MFRSMIAVSGIALMAAWAPQQAMALDLGISVGPVSVDASVGSGASVDVGVGDTSVGVSVGSEPSSPTPSEPASPSPGEPSSPSQPQPGSPSEPSSPSQPSSPSGPASPSPGGNGEAGGNGGAQPGSNVRSPATGAAAAVPVQQDASPVTRRTTKKAAPARPAKPRIDPSVALDGSRRAWAFGSEAAKLKALLSLVDGCTLQDVDFRRSVNDRRIRIVPLDRGLGADSMSQLLAALVSPVPGRSEAVVAVRDNRILGDVVGRAGYDPQDVVAVQIGKNGATDVFVQQAAESSTMMGYAPWQAPPRLLPAVEKDLCVDPPEEPLPRTAALTELSVMPKVPASLITAAPAVVASPAESVAAEPLARIEEDPRQLVALLDQTESLDRLLRQLDGAYGVVEVDEANGTATDLGAIVEGSHARVQLAALPNGRNLLIDAGVEPPTWTSPAPDAIATAAVANAADQATAAIEEISRRAAEARSAMAAPVPAAEGRDTATVAAVDDADALALVPDIPAPAPLVAAKPMSMEPIGLPFRDAPAPLPTEDQLVAMRAETKPEVELDEGLLPSGLGTETDAIIAEACQEFVSDMTAQSNDFDMDRLRSAAKVDVMAVPGCAPAETVRVAFQDMFKGQQRIETELRTSGHDLGDVMGVSSGGDTVTIYVVDEPSP